ncbi:hypothetical protein ALC62_10910 [Cyphomyrmex costatus]|uniref:Uncharacterized protein n=1 Tax=Cyphomyrmex costatus TaxID=456900 RepID=A0A151IDC1_9HYME|nr:hypothetical protein ALC62_10910 [Cyphomyrmex costatus]
MSDVRTSRSRKSASEVLTSAILLEIPQSANHVVVLKEQYAWLMGADNGPIQYCFAPSDASLAVWVKLFAVRLVYANERGKALLPEVPSSDRTTRRRICKISLIRVAVSPVSLGHPSTATALTFIPFPPFPSRRVVAFGRLSSSFKLESASTAPPFASRSITNVAKFLIVCPRIIYGERGPMSGLSINYGQFSTLAFIYFKRRIKLLILYTVHDDNVATCCKEFLQLHCYARKTLERFAIKAFRVLKLTPVWQSTNLRHETLVRRRDAEIFAIKQRIVVERQVADHTKSSFTDTAVHGHCRDRSPFQDQDNAASWLYRFNEETSSKNIGSQNLYCYRNAIVLSDL